MTKLSPRSADAWRRFRERVAEHGGTVVEPKWLGNNTPHRVICAAGHECAPRPGNVQQGRGLCLVCAGKDFGAAWRRFQGRIAELGGDVTEPQWLGDDTPHRVVCAAGHACNPIPTNVLRGRGLCRICAQQDPIGAERRFRQRVEELGGTAVEQGWRGNGTPHRVICAAGHECSVRPGNLQRGGGLCRICAGLDPADSEQRFRERVAELGGQVIEPTWLGVHQPHRVICAKGHECAPYPGRVRDGQGLCRICAWSSSNALYVVENEPLCAIKLGIATGDGAARLGHHRRDGFATVLRFLPGLDDAAFLEAHTLKTLKAAGVKPVRGLEYFDRAPALPVVLDIVDNWT